MTDEKYVLSQDTREKKFTARSAMRKRTHCGKGGRVRFPSDNLTKKEREAMNGECKSYKLNAPMNWEAFRVMPEDLQKQYIQILRKRFNVPACHMAEMFDTTKANLSFFLCSRGWSEGKRSGTEKWDKEGWLKWCNGIAEDKSGDTSDENYAELTRTSPEYEHESCDEQTELAHVQNEAEVMSGEEAEEVLELLGEKTEVVDWKRNYEKARDLNLALISEKAQMEKEICDLRMRLHQALDFSNCVRPSDGTDWEVEYRNCCVEKDELADECKRLTMDYQKLKLQMEAQKMLMDSMERKCDILRAKVEMAELIFGGRKCMAEV